MESSKKYRKKKLPNEYLLYYTSENVIQNEGKIDIFRQKLRIFFFLVFALHDMLKKILGFPGGAVVENPPANAGDTGSIPGLGRSHMLWNN